MKNKIPLAFKSKLDAKLNQSNEVIYIRAPGRINLIGEHTDYNNGLVLPGAIDKYMYFACVPNDSTQINATAIDLNESITLELNDLKKTTYLWANFLSGILLEFQKLEINALGFDCAFTSDIPIGAGLSSSSALECAFLFGIKELYQVELTNWDLINMSKSSNHNFLGIKGGIMDQFASLFGLTEKIMLLDCDSLEHKYIDLPSNQFSWLLVNSCVKHNHLESGYNNRVKECALALKEIKIVFPNVKHLSSITESDQLSQVDFSSPILKNRAKFVIEENARVRTFIKNLILAQFDQCGILLNASHEGLSKEYEVSCPEMDFLVESLVDNKAVLGSRMMGGGFGGCTINLIEAEAINDIKTIVFESYKNKFDVEPKFYNVNISKGAERLSS